MEKVKKYLHGMFTWLARKMLTYFTSNLPKSLEKWLSINRDLRFKKQTPALTPVRLSSKKKREIFKVEKKQPSTGWFSTPHLVFPAFACHLVRENGHVNNFMNAHHSA